MDKQAFAETMSMIASAYCKSNLLEKKVLTTWYKFLGKFEESVFQNAAENYIRQNGRCPAISDLYAECRNVEPMTKKALETEQEEKLIGDDWMDCESPWGW